MDAETAAGGERRGGSLPPRKAEHYDPQEIKARLRFLDLVAHEGIAVRRSGPGRHVAICPFHQEKSGSFTIYSERDAAGDHAHCFGCGWNGDIFTFWRERHGGDFVAALAPLASLASVSPSVFEGARQRAAQVPRMTVRDEPREKPALPRLAALTKQEITHLAALRSLSVDGVTAAAFDKRVGFCVWPQFEYDGRWVENTEAAPCWVVTDRERAVAQFRRFDGAKFARRDGKEIKAWTKGSPTWPIGASEIGERPVLLVEGGADMLAAYHFLALFGRLRAVAVVAMLGASCAIALEALPFFARRRVRLIMHVDEPDPRNGKTAGVEAAARWTEQLTAAGAAVESFSLEGLMRRDGAAVGDLNDLALCEESVWLEPELRSAFWDFDF